MAAYSATRFSCFVLIARSSRPYSGAASDSLADLVERGLLRRADLLPVLGVRLGDRPGEREHEGAVVGDLLRGRFFAQERGGLTDPRHSLALQICVRAVAVPVELRLRRDDLVEQLAVSVLLARVGVRMRERDRLAERASALRPDH